MNTEICSKCGKTKLDSCDGKGTHDAGFCAFVRCANLGKLELELLELKRQKHSSLLNWFDIDGQAVTKKGQTFRTCSVGIWENPWIIVWTSKMTLKAMKRASFRTIPDGIPDLGNTRVRG